MLRHSSLIFWFIKCRGADPRRLQMKSKIPLGKLLWHSIFLFQVAGIICNVGGIDVMFCAIDTNAVL